MIEWGSLPADRVMSRQFYQLLALMECQSNSENVVVKWKEASAGSGGPKERVAILQRMSVTHTVRDCRACHGFLARHREWHSSASSGLEVRYKHFVSEFWLPCWQTMGGYDERAGQTKHSLMVLFWSRVRPIL
jgi:hypothetical protein